jgi:hypothetical protein
VVPPRVTPAAAPGALTPAAFTHLLPSPAPTTWKQYAGGPPVGLLPADAASTYKGLEDVMEKNWMPLVWRGRLYVVTSLVPHRVGRVWPNGTVVTRYETDSSKAGWGRGWWRVLGGWGLGGGLCRHEQQRLGRRAGCDQGAKPLSLSAACQWACEGEG